MPRQGEIITFRGEAKSIREWAKVTGQPYGRLRHRLRVGWTIDRALNEPAGHGGDNGRKGKVVEYLGIEKTIRQWCRDRGVAEDLVRNRLKQGWSFADAISVRILQGPNKGKWSAVE